MKSTILGARRLRSFEMENVETKERSKPFGPDPRGSLILHPDGRMAALITPGKQTASEGDQTAPVPRLVAYSGRFRLEVPDRLITTVDVASFDEWVGTDQARTYVVDGDALNLRTPPGRMPSKGDEDITVIGILSWTREGPEPIDEPTSV